jgi:hypothetical protein
MQTPRLGAPGWQGNNRARLQAMIDTYGRGAPAYDPAHKPVAIFDWDNTIIKNDIGDGSFWWLVQHGKIRQPPDANWHHTSRYLTASANQALRAACGTDTPAGHRLDSVHDAACAAELWSVYDHAQTTRREPAFATAGYSHRLHVPAYAWAAQLEAGYTVGEVMAMALEAIQGYLAAPVAGGDGEHPSYIRVYEPMRELVQALEAAGFDVWVLSASPEPVVKAAAGLVAVAPDHVVGIRTLADATGRLTYGLAGCGPIADGEEGIIPYVDGKRCFMNEVIFGVAKAQALAIQDDPRQRPVFAAGDAETDVSFVSDATGLRLAIDRQKSELMCQAYFNEDGRWLVNAMFIAPTMRRQDPYPCAEHACKGADGELSGCFSPRHQLIPDQFAREPASP